MMDENWYLDEPDERARQREKQALHKAKLEAAVAELSRNSNGQYFLRWLVQGSGVFRAGFPMSHAEAAFDAGQRKVGMAILELCAAVGAGNILINNDEVNENA